MIKKPVKDNFNRNNYWPSDLSFKNLRQIMHSRLINYLNAINAIPHFQFGFKSNYSTTQQLLRLSEHINYGFERK